MRFLINFLLPVVNEGLLLAIFGYFILFFFYFFRQLLGAVPKMLEKF